MNAHIRFDRVSYEVKDPSGSPVKILDQLSIEFRRGEFTAIIGANGSGKTTLIRHINGLLLPTQGKVSVDDLDTRQPENLGRLRQRIGMVFQFPEDQVVGSTIEEDTAFGPENMAYPAVEIRRRVEEALKQVGLWEERSRPPYLISAGQQQRLALAGVLALQPDVLVFDEATSMLDPVGRREALSLLHDLHRQGKTILMITHAMEEAVQAERIVVLHQGRVVLDGAPLEVFARTQDLAGMGLALPPAADLAARLRTCLPGLSGSILTEDQLLAALPAWSGTEAAIPQPRGSGTDQPDGPAWLEVADLGYTYMAGAPFAHDGLEDIRFACPSGRSLGLMGVTGSGKSTLLQHLNGLLRPQRGTIRLGDFLMNDKDLLTRDIIRKVGLVFQNPEVQFFEQWVGDEIAFGPRQLQITSPLAERVAWAMEVVGLDFSAFKDRLVVTLSGGEKRKVALASALALKPEVLLLDEPTAGLDPHSHAEVLQRLSALKAEGMTLVVSSHQAEDIARLADRLILLKKGRVAASGPVAEVFGQEREMSGAGLEPPLVTRVVQRMGQLNWPAGLVGSLHPGDLVEAVQRVTG